MCKMKICKETIAAIKLDIVQLRENLKATPINYSDRREQIQKEIIYAEEIIADLEEKLKVEVVK